MAFFRKDKQPTPQGRPALASQQPVTGAIEEIFLRERRHDEAPVSLHTVIPSDGTAPTIIVRYWIAGPVTDDHLDSCTRFITEETHGFMVGRAVIRDRQIFVEVPVQDSVASIALLTQAAAIASAPSADFRARAELLLR